MAKKTAVRNRIASRKKAKVGGRKKAKPVARKIKAVRKKAKVGKKPALRLGAAPRLTAAAPRLTAAAAPSPAAAPAGPGTIIPIPPTNTFNQNLHSAAEATMLQVFGVPGQKTDDCSDPTGAFKERIVFSVNVGPFKVSGLDIAVNSLKAVFVDATAQIPAVRSALKNDGMLCVRQQRGNPNSFSNHSWGAAIDLFFGSAAVPQ